MRPLPPAPCVSLFIRWTRGSDRGRKLAVSLFAVAVLLALGAQPARGQSALDGFDTDADGAVEIFVVQPDGKILIAGQFNTVSPKGGLPVTRHRMARLNPDGSLDSVFNPDPNDAINTLELQADGTILVGGYFSNIGGQNRKYIARLNGTTGQAESFNPDVDNIVIAIAVQADGKILVGGSFSNIGGVPRKYIARLDAATGLPDSFDPNPNGSVSGFSLQTDGKILVCGNFTNIGGQPRRRLARLDSTTGQADSFNPNTDSSGFPTFHTTLQADGKILVHGIFFQLAGQPRRNLARVNEDGTLDAAFNPNLTAVVQAIALQPDGKILAGGVFTTIGGQPRNRIARLDPVTGNADSFNPDSDDQVHAIAVQADGKILAGGFFTNMGGHPRNHIARLESDGSVEQTLNLRMGTFYEVFVTAVQADGKILIGGQFDNVLGVPRANLARLNANGTLDLAFDPSPNSYIQSITLQADGKILVGGNFTSIGGQARNRIARLDATTGLADSFNPNANDEVRPIVVQLDGKILVGGYFTSIGGQVRNRCARLDPTTGLADTLDPNADNYLQTVALQADGKILVGGAFTTIGGQTRRAIARLDPTTGLADSFNPFTGPTAGQMISIVVQPDGKILVSGEFSSIGGQSRKGFARLDPASGLADSFDPNADNSFGGRSMVVQADGKILVGGVFSAIGGQPRRYFARLDPITALADPFDPKADSIVYSLALQADGKILAGGLFGVIGGQRRQLFARLTNDTPALQELAVGPTTVTWTRGGSSPQFAQVSFEYSTDNTNYTPLGIGTFDGSNWSLTGLSFPTGQNFYIRARGYYSTGFAVESGSVAESVRTAFLAPPPTPTPTPTAPPSPTPTPSATAPPSPTLTPGPTPTPGPASQAINLSTRMRVQTEDNVGIGGFIITGTAPKHLLLRGIGPSLTQFGVPNALPDPVLELHGQSINTTTNDNWRDDPAQEAAILASGLAPTNDLESAIDVTLNPGAYTVVVRGKNNTTGVALVEVYDLSQAVPAKLANISTRAFVSTGDDIVIAGFILGNQSGSDRIVVRGIGPSLTSVGVPNALANPTLELRDSNGALLIANNNWQDDPNQAAELMAAGLAPTNPLESGIAATLPPGLYTTLLAGLNNGTGIGLVEVYDRGGGNGTPSPTATATPTPSVTPPASPTPSATPSGTPTPVPIPSPQCFVNEHYDNITTLPGAGWVQINHSVPATNGWFQGNGAIFPSQSGVPASYIATNFTNGPNAFDRRSESRASHPAGQPAPPPTPTPTATPPTNALSNWLLTPPLTVQNGAMMTFYTRTVDAPQFPDRLQVRMSLNGSSTNVGTTPFGVGDFTVLMLDINPGLTTTGYPSTWTQFTVAVSGVPTPTTGRLAFRYYVPNGGPNTPYGDYIGVDTVSFFCMPPTPTPTPFPTPTSAPGTPGPSSAAEHSD